MYGFLYLCKCVVYLSQVPVLLVGCWRGGGTFSFCLRVCSSIFAVSCQKINRSHAHAHDNRTNHSHDTRVGVDVWLSLYVYVCCCFYPQVPVLFASCWRGGTHWPLARHVYMYIYTDTDTYIHIYTYINILGLTLMCVCLPFAGACASYWLRERRFCCFCSCVCVFSNSRSFLWCKLRGMDFFIYVCVLFIFAGACASCWLQEGRFCFFCSCVCVASCDVSLEVWISLYVFVCCFLPAGACASCWLLGRRHPPAAGSTRSGLGRTPVLSAAAALRTPPYHSNLSFVTLRLRASLLSSVCSSL